MIQADSSSQNPSSSVSNLGFNIEDALSQWTPDRKVLDLLAKEFAIVLEELNLDDQSKAAADLVLDTIRSQPVYTQKDFYR